MSSHQARSSSPRRRARSSRSAFEASSIWPPRLPCFEEAERRLDDHKHLILDLNGATFIDSSVINVIIRAHRTASARGRVAVLELGPNAVVERALDISGITQIVPRAYSRADAIHTIHRAAEPERRRSRVIGSGHAGERLQEERRLPSTS